MNRYLSILLLFVGLVALSCGRGILPSGESIDTPVGSTTATPAPVNNCNAGNFCLIFSTTNAIANGDIDTNSNGNGIVEADAICNGDANKPTTNNYKALIVDSVPNRTACTNANCAGGTAGQLDWVFQANTEYRRADATTVIDTTNANRVFAFPLNNAIATAASIHWTGLSNDWQTNANHRLDWNDGTGGNNGATGSGTSTGTSGLGNTSTPCNIATARLYCVEQP